MKIIKTDQWQDNKIIVTVEGFPHAQPVFDSNLTQEELQIKVDEWAIIQSEIDSINNGTATQEIIDKHKPKIKFNAILARKRMGELFPTERIIALSAFAFTIQSFLETENWVKLKELFNGLVQNGLAMASDYQIMDGILKEQGVNLDSI